MILGGGGACRDAALHQRMCKCYMLFLCWFNAGPASQTVNQL